MFSPQSRTRVTACAFLACGLIFAGGLWIRSRPDAVSPAPRGAANSDFKLSAALAPATPPPAPGSPQAGSVAAFKTPPVSPPDRLSIPPGGSPEIVNSTAATILSQRVDLSDPSVRAEVVRKLAEAAQAERQFTVQKARTLNLPLVTSDGAVLAGFEGDQPIYDRDENVNAAISTATNLVRDTNPYSVDGAGHIIGLWEAGGIPRATHQEIAGRLTINDGGGTITSHATHVAGTLIATGINSSVEGMAPHASILAHDSDSDVSEMTALAAAAPNIPGTIYVSNHSYGTLTGWTTGPWRFYGTFSNDGNPDNDYPDRFGRYTSTSAAWDGLAWNAPYFLSFKSGGNDRNDNHPGNGTVWRLNSSTGTQYTYDSASHPLADYEYYVSGGVNGFSTVGQRATSKNVVAVGSVTDAVSGGSRNVGNAGLSSFSSAGPTDDGRIKPDIVANGAGLISLDSDSDTDTTSKDGTSMAAPNACGSALLLQEYYDDRFPGQAMRSSMLKGLLIHTADDLGNAGPDYRFGWGLLNTQAAAALIKAHADVPTERRMMESQLDGGMPSESHAIAWDGSSPIRITLSWTDPPGADTTVHDSRAPRLVHDLDLKITAPDGTTGHFPWVMPWVGDWTDANLNAPATTGVNTVDNVEQVYVASPAMAGKYTVTVNHAGALSQGPQVYSLLVSGGVIPSGYGAWALDEYGADWNTPSIAGFGVDGEGDGNGNGLEYAFGLDKDGFEIANEEIYALGEETIGPDTFLTITYDRDTSKTDIAYEAQWSPDMETWLPLASVVQATNGPIETVKASLLKDGTRKFVRLVVTQL